MNVDPITNAGDSTVSEEGDQTAQSRESTIANIIAMDSHTGGEPTRVVLEGGPDLGSGSLSQRLDRFRNEFDSYRVAIVGEPRGSDVMVGALLCEPTDHSCDVGVIFFNNTGYLGMCGHGTIGLVETLRQCGRIQSDQCRIETPVGVVDATLHEDGTITISNVDSFRAASDVKIDADGVGTVVGDVAWGGNWFFLVREPLQVIGLHRVSELQEMAIAIRKAVNDAGYTKVDHIELYGEPHRGDADARNFVLCPGLEYDRSPCGTGTSAKLACLAADGKLQPGEDWIQEGILGASFVGRYEWADESKEKVRPTITGQSFLTAEVRLRMDENDPFCWGVRDLSRS